jgi:hypothetical protein
MTVASPPSAIFDAMALATERLVAGTQTRRYRSTANSISCNHYRFEAD